MVRLLSKEDEAQVKEIDSGVKNKFRWSWLERTVTVKVKIGKNPEEVVEKLVDYIAKCDLPGKAQCTYCNDTINYGSRGCIALIEHATKSQKHANMVAIRRTNYSLGTITTKPAAKMPTTTGKEAQVKLGLGLQITKSQSNHSQAMAAATPESRPVTSINDRKVKSEALVLGVIAEHSLPLSMAPVILDTAKELAKDPKALNQMNLERTTASYKMRFGLAKTFEEETIHELRSSPFSLNIDESTSKSDKRVLAILASYFSSFREAVVVEHLASLEVIHVNSESLFKELEKLFIQHSIPWANVVSILMDSCAVMRGSKNGLETKIRNSKAPQLLDIDGDSCHHMHNACKQFCKPFENWVEYLQSDLHNDVKWSPDFREHMIEICMIIGLKFTMPERFLNHRWLSCCDCCNSNIHMNAAFKVFYYPFLSKEDQLLFREPTIREITNHSASAEGVKRIKEIWKTLGSKQLTDDGRKRKIRIAEKLIIQHKKTALIMNFYLSVLPILKEYVCLFQSSEPLIHVLHDRQEQVFKDFLGCFVKSEYLVGKTAKQLKSMDLDGNHDLLLSSRNMFLGRRTKELVECSHKTDTTVLNFLKKASAAYLLCAKHMQKKLPLDNNLLRCLSALDPQARGHSVTAKALKELGSALKPFLAEEQLDRLDLEIHRFQVDSTIKQIEAKQRVDDWWAAVIREKKYPALCRMATVCLSCFHGPRVESSFSLMGDVDIRSTRMKITTMSAIQTVKYGLKSRKSSSLQLFKKGDVKHEKVDGNLCYNFRNAASSYRREKEGKKRMKEEQEKALNLKLKQRESRAEQKKKLEQAAKIARMTHQKAQKKKATKFLKELVAKRKCKQ